MFNIDPLWFMMGVCIGLQSASYALFFYYTRKTNKAILIAISWHHGDIYRMVEESREKVQWPPEHKWCGCNRCAQEKAFKFLDESRAASRHGNHRTHNCS